MGIKAPEDEWLELAPHHGTVSGGSYSANNVRYRNAPIKANKIAAKFTIEVAEGKLETEFMQGKRVIISSQLVCSDLVALEVGFMPGALFEGKIRANKVAFGKNVEFKGELVTHALTDMDPSVKFKGALEKLDKPPVDPKIFEDPIKK